MTHYMKKIINTVFDDALMESPQCAYDVLLRIKPTTFSLNDIDVNKNFAEKQINKVVDIIEDTSDYKIVRTGDNEKGWIFLYNINKKTADYVIQIKSKNWKWLSKTVTQCVLWRNPNSPYSRNVTSRVFFNYLLLNYPAIMCDYQQTDNGHDFWIARMNDAVNLNYKVGIANIATHSSVV